MTNKTETKLNQSAPKQYCRHAGYSAKPEVIFCYLAGDNVPSDKCKGCRKFQREDNEACYGR